MPAVEIEDGWLVGGMRRAGGNASSPTGSRQVAKQKRRQKAHAAALTGIVAGTMVLLCFSLLPSFEHEAEERHNEESLKKLGLSAQHHMGSSRGGALGGAGSPEAGSAELGQFWVPSGRTSSEKLADMKRDVVSGSMLAGSSRVEQLDGNVTLQKSPQGPLESVHFQAPEGKEYRVQVEFFFEIQSHATKMFTEWVLVEVVNAAGMKEVMNLKMVPWGNTKIVQSDGKPIVVSGDGNATKFEGGGPKFLCQHGPSECEGNTYLSCISDMYPDIDQWFSVETCMITSSCAEGESPASDSVVATGAAIKRLCKGQPADTAPSCFRQVGYGMDLEKVKECVHSPYGLKLLLENMDRTARVVPKLTHLPAVTIDGVILNRTQLMLMGKSICERYVHKAGPLMGIDDLRQVPRPLGCFFFPNEPPLFPEFEENYLPIKIMYAAGGLVFVLGVGVLAYWKYMSMSGQEYEQVDGQ